jgi:hypothetical protein
MNILFNNIGKLSNEVYNEQKMLDKYLDKITMDEDKLLDIFSNMKILLYEYQNNDNNLLLNEFNKLKSEIIKLQNDSKLQLQELNNILNYLNNSNNIDITDIEFIQGKKKEISKKLKYIKSLLKN